MANRNEPIGTVECPCKGCTQSCKVYRYRERGDSERSIANRRFANKLYGRCPDHGRFGGDAGDDAMQAYIETHSKKLPVSGAPTSDHDPPVAKSPAIARRAPPTRKVIAPAASPAKNVSNGWMGWPWD